MNWQTILVLIVVAAIFLAVVIKGIVDKKKGKSSCNCGCEGCAYKDSCKGENK